MIIALPQLDARRLAADYCDLVRAALTADQLARVVDRNSREHDPLIDHVHDYLDAGDVMAEAITRQYGQQWHLSELPPATIERAFQRARDADFQLHHVLVACEFSGRVRDEFVKRGHSAMSCDVRETEMPGRHHLGDVREILNDGWHMMLSFPPCRYLCSSGLHWNKGNPERQQKTEEALDFVRELLAAPIEKISLENSVGCIGTRIRKADQWIHPHQFGDDASKTTGLWLKNLPLLIPTQHVAPRIVNGKPRWANQTDSGQNRETPTKDPEVRRKNRSRTYPGIARAMAEQWGGILSQWLPLAA